MLYARSFLLLAGLPAVLSFGVAPELMEDESLQVEASAAVELDVMNNYPDDVCMKLKGYVDRKLPAPPKVLTREWCNQGKPSQQQCTGGNRLRLGPASDMGAKTMTLLGEATIYDICAWDPNFKNRGKGKCVMSGFSYRCLNSCPGLQNPFLNRNRRNPAASNIHLQTECMDKSRLSKSQWYKDRGEWVQKWLPRAGVETCEQRLVQCCRTQTWVTPWNDKACGKQRGTKKDGCCSGSCPGRRLEEEDFEDDETKLEPREARRLQDVCPGLNKVELGDGSLCCEGTTKLFPDTKWLAKNPGRVGYAKNLAERKEYEVLETCGVKGGKCSCSVEEKRLEGFTADCNNDKPHKWVGRG